MAMLVAACFAVWLLIKHEHARRRAAYEEYYEKYYPETDAGRLPSAY